MTTGRINQITIRPVAGCPASLSIVCSSFQHSVPPSSCLRIEKDPRSMLSPCAVDSHRRRGQLPAKELDFQDWNSTPISFPLLTLCHRKAPSATATPYQKNISFFFLNWQKSLAPCKPARWTPGHSCQTAPILFSHAYSPTIDDVFFAIFCPWRHLYNLQLGPVHGNEAKCKIRLIPRETIFLMK